VFILGSDGRVQDFVDLFCENEDEAIKAAEQLVDGHDVELWQRESRIERFNGLGQQLPVLICEHVNP
jgi:hypothetical protein